MASNTILEATGLTKHYGSIQAVNNLDLRIEAGTIYALLGPNGAGKTTTLSMLTTLIQPTSGTATVAGYDVVRQADKVRQNIGVTFQEIVLDKELTGEEVLHYHARLYGMSPGARTQKVKDLLALVELEDAAGRMVKEYSGGMKRRLELARGLMTSPKILFLDEPTQGLDPQNRTRIWDYLMSLRKQNGLTIVLTTHYMEEAEFLADKVGIVDRGMMVVEGAISELIAGMGADIIRVEGRGDSTSFITALEELPYVQHVSDANNMFQIGVDAGETRLASIVNLATEKDYRIQTVEVAKPGLGDVFLMYTGRNLRD